MWHTVLITIHAVTGVAALVAGCVALWRRAVFSIYLWSLVATILFLALAIAEEWGSLDDGTRVLFVAFLALGGLMVWRAWLAGRMQPMASAAATGRFVEHVGFTLVALFDAFVVITVLNIGAPVWMIVGVGVGIAIAGHFVLRAYVTGLARRSERARP